MLFISTLKQEKKFQGITKILFALKKWTRLFFLPVQTSHVNMHTLVRALEKPKVFRSIDFGNRQEFSMFYSGYHAMNLASRCHVKQLSLCLDSLY